MGYQVRAPPLPWPCWPRLLLRSEMANRLGPAPGAREVGTYLSLVAAGAGLAYGATLLYKKVSSNGSRHRVHRVASARHTGHAAVSAPPPAAPVVPDARLAGLIVVVGVGGVGSHAAHVLTRSGATNLRLVDFDLITLSSLNRHCSAVHADVGRLKTTVLAEYIRSYAAAGCRVEEIPETFDRETADCVLRDGAKGTPDKIVCVLDCIDNTATKAELLAQCMARGLAVVSSMGAGSRADPTRLHLSNISEVKGDELGRAVRMELVAAARRSEKEGRNTEGDRGDDDGGGGGGGARRVSSGSKASGSDAGDCVDLTQVQLTHA